MGVWRWVGRWGGSGGAGRQVQTKRPDDNKLPWRRGHCKVPLYRTFSSHCIKLRYHTGVIVRLFPYTAVRLSGCWRRTLPCGWCKHKNVILCFLSI